MPKLTIMLDNLYKFNPNLFYIEEYEEWIDNFKKYKNLPSNFCYKHSYNKTKWN